jgi:IS5 family transposase
MLQSELFPRLAEENNPLSATAQRLVSTLAMIPLARFVPAAGSWNGRPQKDRIAVASAFVAKAVHNFATTRQLLERLASDAQLRRICGWKRAEDVPHESTFSRAFAEFASMQLAGLVHEALIRETHKDRLVGHIARDSTAIEARQRLDERPTHRPLPPRRPGRPKKASKALPSRRLPRQRRQTVEEMIEELPRHCSAGVKKGSNGQQQFWYGYKLHLDVADGQIPVSCVLTAASLHDSQVAVPLATITAERVTSLYDLMDSAYDATEIREHSRSLGHVPIIAPNQSTVPIPNRVHASKTGYRKRIKNTERRPRKAPPLTPAEKDRYKERTMSERVNARLKDEFGGRSIRVRGHGKVMAHLMFGILALTVDQLLKLAG